MTTRQLRQARVFLGILVVILQMLPTIYGKGNLANILAAMFCFADVAVTQSHLDDEKYHGNPSLIIVGAILGGIAAWNWAVYTTTTQPTPPVPQRAPEIRSYTTPDGGRVTTIEIR